MQTNPEISIDCATRYLLYHQYTVRITGTIDYTFGTPEVEERSKEHFPPELRLEGGVIWGGDHELGIRF